MSPRRTTRPAGPTAVDSSGSTVVRFPGLTSQQRRARRWAAVATALLLSLGAVWVLFFSSVLAVDRIEVTGTALVDRAEVERRLEPLAGTPLPRVGTDEVAALLADMPGIASVGSTLLPPTAVRAEITETVPVAREEGAADPDVLLADGSVLADVPAQRLAAAVGERDLPVAGGDLLTADVDTRRSAAEALRSLPPELARRTAVVLAETPELVRLDLRQGPTLVWGDASRHEQKAAAASAFLASETAGAGATEIDVSVPDRVITR